MSFLDKFFCNLTGHRLAMLQYGEGRIWLRCDCGWESAGWTVSAPKAQRNVLAYWLRPARAERKSAAA